MNKLSNYLLLFFISAGFMFLASCGEDTETPTPSGTATIEFERSGVDITDTTAAPGDSIIFDINVDFDEDRAPLTLIVEDGDGNEVVPARPLSTDPLTALQTGYKIPEEASGTITITAILEDEDGTEVASENFTIEVVPPTPFTTYSAVILAAPTGNETSDSFFSSSTGMLYSFNDVVSTSESLSPEIDFGYFYGDDLDATLSSPDEWPDDATLYNGLERWGTRNNTDFRTIESGAVDFDAIDTGNDIEAEFETNSGNDVGGRASNLSEGDIIAFSTADDRFGIIEVVTITGTDGSDGRIEIRVKVTTEE